MSTKKQSAKVVYLPKFTSRKNNVGGDAGADADPERFATWMQEYQALN